ncbi:protein of unknown function [Amycolatopsis lurida]|uniref:DUF4190 domain-containing protein n=1 Tax=Amycolatopsis lurida NRRL 2430 TaxID=1460371 RepID=A0A2P2FWR4_AMYLU|nr:MULTISPECIES: DUF4190 domain-containing protein [Amycolatopsis]KFU81181.1 hypothetical protein BB31_12435 [Amycolatopsis lurida NRRL 2430]QXV60403.1 DUF4190 domain-containing protein [Amycolatopsis sp. TNS106]SED54289.1 protein of unknown function [Amycolatopsis lurida]
MTYPQDPYGHQQPYGQQPPYGQPYQQPGYGYGPPQPPQEQGLAIAALVVSIASLVACSGLPSIAGVIMGHIAHSKAKRGEAGGQGMALAAIIIGYIGVAIIVLLLAGFIFVGILTDWDFD